MILRNEKRNREYTIIANQVLRNESLTWKARGILSYLLSMPDDWQIYLKELVKRAPDGIDSLRSGIKELEALGYITKEQARDEKGKMAGYEYIVHETPKEPTTVYGKTVHGKTVHGKTVYGKSNATKYLLNKIPTEPNTDITNTEQQPDKTSSQDLPNGNSHKEMVIALESLTGMDMKIKTNAGRIVKVAKELRDAGYSFQNVNQFGELWQSDWRYKQNKTPPTLAIIKAEIGRTKNAATPKENRTNKFREKYKEQG